MKIKPSSAFINNPNTESILEFPVYSGFLSELDLQKKIINTINPHSYIVAKEDIVFQQALKESDVLLPDGIGIVMAARFLNKKKIFKIAGSDIHLHLLDRLNQLGGKCFYLGASENTLSLIIKKNELKFPNVKSAGYSPPFKDSFTKEDNQQMIKAVNDFSPDVLFVGMTAPKQEKWVYQHKHMLNVRCICCIGAVFDFYAGTKKRPGKFWIAIGLEFLPRLLKEPSRLWKRNFISTPLFVLDMFKWKLKSQLKKIK